MKGKLIVLIAAIAITTTCQSQIAPTYNWSWKKDGIVLASNIIGYSGSRYLVNRAGLPTMADVQLLDQNSVWGIDRGAISNYSHGAGNTSDMFLYGSLALPFLSYLDKKAYNEKGAIFGMMFETLLINYNLTNTLKATTQRFRPYTYNSELSESERLSPTARQSFISGHTSTVAATSFFTAKVLTDLHPDSKFKPLIWASAIILPATTGYLRYKAGKHFPSDIAVGYGVGALIGFFVPQFHKINTGDRMKLGILPMAGGLGMSLTMNLNDHKAEKEFLQF